MEIGNAKVGGNTVFSSKVGVEVARRSEFENVGVVTGWCSSDPNWVNTGSSTRGSVRNKKYWSSTRILGKSKGNFVDFLSSDSNSVSINNSVAGSVDGGGNVGPGGSKSFVRVSDIICPRGGEIGGKGSGRRKITTADDFEG